MARLLAVPMPPTAAELEAALCAARSGLGLSAQMTERLVLYCQGLERTVRQQGQRGADEIDRLKTIIADLEARAVEPVGGR